MKKIWNIISRFFFRLFDKTDWSGFSFGHDDPHKRIRAMFPHLRGTFQKPPSYRKGNLYGLDAYRAQRRALGFRK